MSIVRMFSMESSLARHINKKKTKGVLYVKEKTIKR